MEGKYFKLFSFNLPVRGDYACAIYNLQHGCIYNVPSYYYTILSELSSNSGGFSFVEAERKMQYEVRNFLRELRAKEIGFFTNYPQAFLPIEEKVEVNSFIESAIVDFSEKFDSASVFGQLDDLFCKYLEIRFENVQIKSAKDLFILELLEVTSIRALNIVLNYRTDLDLSFARECFDRYPKLMNIIVLSAPTFKQIRVSDKCQLTYLTNGFREVAINELLPIQNKKIVNSHFFFRSKQTNPYYFGKICISKQGEFKNNLQHYEVFGNIKDMTIKSSLEQTRIKELWNISVDQIETIKDSHLRYAEIVSGRLVKIADDLYRLL